MTTDLYIISNIKTSKSDVLEKKDEYIDQLKALKLEHCTYPKIVSTNPYREEGVKEEGDWEYQLPETYDEKTDCIVPDLEAAGIIYFTSPFVFGFIEVYENCLELSSIYRYSYLYQFNELDFMWDFRKTAYRIIRVFGGTEIIYLADNACDKLSKYLECQVWEGVSYHEVKQNILSDGLPYASNYQRLKSEDLSYKDIREVVFDDFKDLKIN